MRKIEYAIVVFLVACGVIISYNGAKAQEIKCYPNAEFMKLVEEKSLVTLYNGMKDGKVNEILMSKDRHLYTIVYDKTENGASHANTYCVIGVVDDVTFNDKAIEFLSNLLEKMKGRDT